MTTTNETYPDGYKPTDDEPFMNANMKAYFREILLKWKSEILEQTQDTVNSLKTESQSHPDAIDRASATADRQLELRSRDRQRKLVSKIEKALACKASVKPPPSIILKLTKLSIGGCFTNILNELEASSLISIFEPV